MWYYGDAAGSLQVLRSANTYVMGTSEVPRDGEWDKFCKDGM